MKKVQTKYQKFEATYNSRYADLINEYEKRISKCREGFEQKVQKIFLNEVFNMLREVTSALGVNGRFFIEIREELELDKEKEFEKLFNQKFTLIFGNNEGALAQLSQMWAYQEVVSYLQNEGFRYEIGDNKSHRTSIKWKGEVELEFVQLIYALYEAGYLNNEKNEITALVSEVAAAFNYKLGKNWQQNLSDNINKRNADYKPPIFKKLEEAFEKHRQERITKKKNNSPK